jgi:hypothetical protein
LATSTSVLPIVRWPFSRPSPSTAPWWEVDHDHFDRCVRIWSSAGRQLSLESLFDLLGIGCGERVLFPEATGAPRGRRHRQSHARCFGKQAIA